MNDVSISQVLSHTPAWVFALFAYLLFVGFRRMRTGVRDLKRIWITPLIFIVWGIAGLMNRPGDTGDVIMRWAVGAIVGAALGLAFAIRLKADRPRGLVLLPGSILPLIRVLVIFGGHYVLRVAAAIHPDMSETYLNWDICVSGASTGYFAGWTARFIASYAKAPDAELGIAATNLDGTA